MNRLVYSSEILGLFRKLDRRLHTGFYSYNTPLYKFDLIAIGGTALEISGVKKVSKDIDLFIELKSVEKLCGLEGPFKFTEKLQKFIKEYFDGSEGICADVNYITVGSWNWLGFQPNKEGPVEKLLCFDLYILDDVDICISKIVRYSEEDIVDIREIISRVEPPFIHLETIFNAFLQHLKNPGDAAIALKNFGRLKEAYHQINPHPRKWYQFWRY